MERLLREELLPHAAVLRHRVEGSGEGAGSDWDLAVRDPVACGRIVESVFGSPLLRIRRQYVDQRFYGWNQVDLLPVFEWNGIEYLDADRFWSGVRTCGDGLPRPRLAHDALVAWLTGVLWGGSYRSKYDLFLKRAWSEDREEFKDCLRSAFGGGWADLMGRWIEDGIPGEAARHAAGLRRALSWQALRRAPGEWVWRQFRHWTTEFRNHLTPPYPWVAVLGPDGSGKSSVISGMTARLASQRLLVKMIHWRPVLFGKGAEVPGGVVTDPHGKPARGVLPSVLKLAMLWLIWRIADLWSLRHPRAKNRVLVSDRYFNDLLVDPRRYRYGGPTRLAAWVFRYFPQPDRVIFLLADAARIHARKQEVTFEELERQLAAYRCLAERLGDRAVIVDAGLPLEDVVDRATEAVIAACSLRREALAATWREIGGRRSEGGVALGMPKAPPMGSGVAAAAAVANAAPPEPGVRTGGPSAGNLRLRVLVSAYACSPVRGAEANVAWNMVRELSQRHELWVLTRANNRKAIEASGEPWLGRVQWVYLDPPQALSFWRQGQRGVHPFYVWWQWLARGKAKELMQRVEFDVVHHVTFGTYLVPSPLADLGVPLVFGPVGGGERTPSGLSDGYRVAGKWEEWMRDFAHARVQRSGFLRHWYRATAWTLATTPVTEETLRRMGVTKVSLMPQSATGGDTLERYIKSHVRPFGDGSGVLRLVTASRLIHWKAIDLALEAVAAAREGGLDVRLTVLQEGPDARALKRHAKDLGLSEVVEFTGRLPTLDDVFARMQGSAALLHPALHEAFGQACLEALALGIPVICLNWGGPGLIVNESCGYKVEPGSRDETVKGLADAIRKLAEDRRNGRDFAGPAQRRASDFQWSGMAREIEGVYGRVVEKAEKLKG